MTGPWQVERGQFLDQGRVVGVFQAIIRPLPMNIPGGLVWINRGPLWRGPLLRDRNGGEDRLSSLSDMLIGLRRHYAEDRHMYLRIAPPVELGSAAAGAVRGTGLIDTATPGWASARLDISQSLDDLRRSLKGKWRGHLSKSERAGIEITSGRTDEMFDVFIDQHRKLIGEKGFATSLTPEMISCLRQQQTEESRMVVFLAHRNGTLQGSVLMAGYSNTVEYLAGNTTDEGRRNNAGQLLLWQAMATMKDQGFTVLDLSGMDENITPRGIYKFKQGLNGMPYRLVSELEAVGGGLLGALVRWRVNRARVDG